MLSRILADPGLDVILSRIDHDLADKARSAGCPCGGVLHSARYPRKPRCGKDLGSDWRWRLSFCCASEGCRGRVTPASVRFLGRRVYPAVLVVLVCALAQGLTCRRRAILRRAIGVDRSTLVRWQRWWRDSFPSTRLWRATSARFLPPVDTAALPLSLLSRFGRWCVEAIVRILRFLSPLSEPASISSRRIR
jgi:hypothetical protein